MIDRFLNTNERTSVMSQVSDILLLVSWGDISRQYFNQKGSWLFHKLQGVDSDNQPVKFTDEEKTQLKGALVDLADRIRRAADNIE